MAEAPPQVRRHYAHFHRVLSELLSTLVAETPVVWLGDEGHELNPDYETNRYHKAIYPLRDLAPYREPLTELAAVQREVMLELALAKPYSGILVPLVLTGVDVIRLNTHTHWTSERLDTRQTLGRLTRVLARARENLGEFEKRRTSFDPEYQRVAAEVSAITALCEQLRTVGEADYRYRTAQVTVLPYTYCLDGSVTNPYVINHGLIAVGPNVRIEANANRRRGRSDKVDAPRLFENKYNRLYTEAAWQHAKKGE